MLGFWTSDSEETACNKLLITRHPEGFIASRRQIVPREYVPEALHGLGCGMKGANPQDDLRMDPTKKEQGTMASKDTCILWWGMAISARSFRGS